jgi:hypothetical protein
MTSFPDPSFVPGAGPQINMVGVPEPVANHPVAGMHIWGWMAAEELAWLGEQAATMRSVVEIGSHRGRSSYALAAACRGPVHCIDPWPTPAAYRDWKRNVGDVFGHVFAHWAYSPAAGAEIEDPVDMVFIDGAHDTASVEADVSYWCTRAQRLVCGHDYNHPGYPEIRPVVDRLLPTARLIPGTSIWAWWPTLERC